MQTPECIAPSCPKSSIQSVGRASDYSLVRLHGVRILTFVVCLRLFDWCASYRSVKGQPNYGVNRPDMNKDARKSEQTRAWCRTCHTKLCHIFIHAGQTIFDDLKPAVDCVSGLQLIWGFDDDTLYTTLRPHSLWVFCAQYGVRRLLSVTTTKKYPSSVHFLIRKRSRFLVHVEINCSNLVCSCPWIIPKTLA